MGIKYSQLDQRTRSIIEYLLEQGLCPARIARHLGVDRSTVGRELRRGWHVAVGRYTAAQGQFVHDKHRRNAGLARRKLGPDLSSPAWQPIRTALRAGWSPQQYCGRMRLIASSVATQDWPWAPLMRSPSQWPGSSRASTSAGRCSRWV